MFSFTSAGRPNSPMRRFWTEVAILALLAGNLARGQTPLSLPEATAMAIKNHPQIAAAQDTAASAGQHITESRAAYYPVLDGEITGSQGLYQSRLGAGALSASQLFNRFGQGLQITQLVTDFGRRKNLVAQSQFQAQAAAQNTQATIY